MKKGLAVAFLVGLASSCGGPTDPTSGAGSAAASGRTFAARVVDGVTGAPVSSATVILSGVSIIHTGADGVFRTATNASAPAGVTIEAPRYWKRETRIRPVSQSAPPVEIELLPDGSEFDLGFFDHVFRNLGAAGSHRWTSEPVFEIWEGVYECTGFVAGGECQELTAREEAAPSVFIDTMRRVIETDARMYTDGGVIGSAIITGSHPPGTVLPRDSYFERGKVTLAFVARPDDLSWAFWRVASDGSMIGGHVHLNQKHRYLRGFYSHELAHTLGFDHPLGLGQVPLPSIMRQGHGDEPTRNDILHGRILYHRAPNSRSPDVDPESFVLNGLRAEGDEAGPEVTRSAP